MRFFCYVFLLTVFNIGYPQTPAHFSKSELDCINSCRWDSVILYLSPAENIEGTVSASRQIDRGLARVNANIWLDQLRQVEELYKETKQTFDQLGIETRYESDLYNISLWIELKHKNIDFVIKASSERLQEEFHAQILNYESLAFLKYLLGKAIFFKGEYQNAADEYSKGLQYLDSAKSNNTYLRLSLSLELGKNLSYSNQPESAFFIIENTLDLSRKVLVRNDPIITNLQLELGWLYNTQGKYHMSLKEYKKVEKTYNEFEVNNAQKSGFFYRLAATLNQVDPERSIGYYRKIISLHENDTLLRSKAIEVPKTYSNMGLSYGILKKFELATHYLKKASLTYNKFIPDLHPSYARVYMNLGRMYAFREIIDSSIYYHTKAINIRKQLNANNHVLIMHYFHFGNACSNFGLNSMAKQHLLTAVALYENSNKQNKFNILRTYSNLAKISINEGDLYSARLFTHKAFVALYGDQFSIENDQSKLYNAGSTYYKTIVNLLNHKAQAESAQAFSINSLMLLDTSLNSFISTLNLIDSSKSIFLNKNTELDFLEEIDDVYARSIAVADALFTVTKDPKYLKTAFDIAQKKKSTVLLQNLHKLKGFESHITEAEREKIETLEEQISQYDNQIKYFEKTKDDSHAEETRKLKFEVQRSFDSLQYKFEQTYPIYARTKKKIQVASLSEVQSSLHPSETLIEYFRTDTALYAFGVNQEDATFQKLPLPQDFEAQLDSFLRSSHRIPKADRAVKKSYAQTAHKFYKILLAPLLDSLKVIPHQAKSKLIIVPDGKLGYIPFDVLLTNTVQDLYDYKSYPFLMKEFVVRSAYSATLMKMLEEKQLEEKELLAAFAPGYLTKADLLSGIKGAGSETCEAPQETDFIELRQAELELNNILKNIKGVRFDTTDASEEQFKEIANNYRILHLNMHGFTNDCDPMYSGLAFTPRTLLEKRGLADLSNPTNEGILHAYEIYNMRINAELVVMSACQTGLGKIQAGEGIMSLARAFAHAGSPNTVMSLWQVDEAATRRLMTDFYKHLGAGKGKDEALQLAKLDYLDNNADAHPFYWAGFVLIGDDKPIVEDSNLNLYAWMIFLFLLILISGFFILRKYSSPAHS